MRHQYRCLQLLIQNLATTSDREDRTLIPQRSRFPKQTMLVGRILDAHQIVLVQGVLELERRQLARVTPEVAVVDLGHCVHILGADLVRHLSLVVQSELEEELVLQHRVLRHLIVDHGFAEFVDLLQQIDADLGHRFDLEFGENVFDVVHGLGVLEAELFDEIQFVVELVELSDEGRFGDRSVHDGGDELVGHGHVLDEGGELGTDGLAIGQLHGHRDGLLLECGDLGANVAQDALNHRPNILIIINQLKTIGKSSHLKIHQHRLHALQNRIAFADLIVQAGNVLALRNVVLDRTIFHLLEFAFHLLGVLAQIGAGFEDLLDLAVFQLVGEDLHGFLFGFWPGSGKNRF